MDATAPPGELSTMLALLSSMGADDHEPRVANMLLDYAYRYVTDVLLDAEVYSMHTGRPAGCVDLDDVLLAAQARSSHSFVPAPSQDVVAALAETVNARELPKYVGKPGLPLPPEDESLTAPGFQLLL